jgi:hypothetical protein
MPNTTYAMSTIKNYVIDLKYRSLDEHGNKISADFEKHYEASAELAADVSRYEAACNEAENLEEKYRGGRYCRYSRDLKSIIKYEYGQARREEGQKIEDQFNAILGKLKTTRNPDKALEFLKLCGIELPEQKSIVLQDIPVDPEFIKSVLPAAKQLTVAD